MGRATQCLVAGLWLAGMALHAAPDQVQLAQARLRPGKTVIVNGTAGKRIANPVGYPTALRLFQMVDLYGDEIRIRTGLDWPVKGIQYYFTGHLERDPILGREVFVEEARQPVYHTAEPQPAAPVAAATAAPELRPPPVPAVASSDQLPAPAAPGLPAYMSWLLGLAAVVFVSLLATLAGLLKGRSSAPQGGLFPAGALDPPRPRPTVPAPVTMKVMPGRFEVLAGEEEFDEIRLYLTPDNLRREWLITRRSDGEPVRPDVIALGSPTVSRHQGRLLYGRDGEPGYSLVNLADDQRNPLEVNGDSLRVNEARPLRDGDEVQVGAVKLRFRTDEPRRAQERE